MYDDQYFLILAILESSVHISVDFLKVYRMVQYFDQLTEMQSIGNLFENLRIYETNEPIIKYKTVPNKVPKLSSDKKLHASTVLD